MLLRNSTLNGDKEPVKERCRVNVEIMSELFKLHISRVGEENFPLRLVIDELRQEYNETFPEIEEVGVQDNVNDGIEESVPNVNEMVEEIPQNNSCNTPDFYFLQGKGKSRKKHVQVVLLLMTDTNFG